MKLVPNERVLLESGDKVLTLTTHRVRFHSSIVGAAKVESIALSELSCCELTYKSYVLLLVLAALCVLGGLGTRNVAEGLVGAAVFAIAYFVTRQHVLRLASSGGQIVVSMKGMTTEKALEFIEQAEDAKLQFSERFSAAAA